MTEALTRAPFPRWPGKRCAGADDYAYLYTLTQAIAAARRLPDEALRRQADEAEAALNAEVAAIPWANPMGRTVIDNGRLQQLRRAVAERIVRLSAKRLD